MPPIPAKQLTGVVTASHDHTGGDGATLYIDTVLPFATFYTATEMAGDITTGGQFAVLEAGAIVSGLWYKSAVVGAHSIKASLWNSAGSSVADGTLACAGPGTYFVPFDSAYTLLAADIGTAMTYGAYETAGNHFCNQATTTDVDAMPIDYGPVRIDEGPRRYAAGDARPTTDGGGTVRYGVAPVIRKQVGP